MEREYAQIEYDPANVGNAHLEMQRNDIKEGTDTLEQVEKFYMEMKRKGKYQGSWSDFQKAVRNAAFEKKEKDVNMEENSENALNQSIQITLNPKESKGLKGNETVLEQVSLQQEDVRVSETVMESMQIQESITAPKLPIQDEENNLFSIPDVFLESENETKQVVMPHLQSNPKLIEPQAQSTQLNAEQMEQTKSADGDLEKEFKKIHGAIKRLENLFQEEIRNTENRDTNVKLIYKELNDYKTGYIEKALKNVFVDLIDLREVMLSQISAWKDKQEADSILLEEFASYADDMADILEKYDVEIYKNEPGHGYIPVRQKIVRKIETEDEALVKIVAESLSYGYMYNGKVIRPEKISVYVNKK